MPWLATLPAVKQCHSVAGEIDLLVLLQVATLAELSDLRERIAAAKGVADVTTVPVLRVALDRR